MKLLVLYLQYDQKKYPNSFEALHQKLKKIFKSVDTDYILIDNYNSSRSTEIIDDHTTIIAGDNTDWEFSGWQKGLSHVKSIDRKYDFMLIVNDAFQASGWTLLDQINETKIILAMKKNSIYGHLDTDRIRAIIDNANVSTWLCTNCFFIPAIIIDQLPAFVSVNENKLNTYLPVEFPPDGQYFLENSGINDALQKFIIHWLTDLWHSRAEITEKNWPFIRAKIKAILNERLFTANLSRKNIKIIPHRPYDARRVIYDLFYH